MQSYNFFFFHKRLVSLQVKNISFNMSNPSIRSLTDNEISILLQQGNHAEEWSRVKVSCHFDAKKIRNNMFFGDVTLGGYSNEVIQHSSLCLPEGIYNCMIKDCTIEDHCAIYNVKILQHYHVGCHSLLLNINELSASDNFAWMEPMNENGGRRILPFAGMTIGDAYLWAKYRDHRSMIQRLETFTHQQLSNPLGGYGQLGSYCVIKNTNLIHNVAVLSNQDTPTLIEECNTLADGVVGYGCHITSGCIVTRFLLGENVRLEYGARINDSVVGDNSTIARCEVGNSLIYPAHEQHHNNSFLIASTVMGQSNLAAGCTIGSNHNGRTADNELVAGRGFWPGLCTSLKHSSSFASYTLLAKGNYPAELCITLPFCLVSNNESKNQLEVMPAYWWMYNMYALNRNITKFAKRDKRTHKKQHIVFTPFAPDTAEEIVNGRMLLKYWIEQAYLSSTIKVDNKELTDNGKIEVTAFGMEKGKRKVVVNKWAKGYKAYEDMLIYYAMGELTHDNTQQEIPSSTFGIGNREREWVNLGGQLIPQCQIDILIHDITTGKVNSWDDIHARYDKWAESYPTWCQQHAYHILCDLYQIDAIDKEHWNNLIIRYTSIRHYVSDQVTITRDKDNKNPFRQMTFRNDAEMNAVLE